MRKGILIVVSGFSGAGKGTLVKRLVAEYDNYALSVSATTRQPRPGEKDGREYFFMDRERFRQKIDENGLIEYACYCDNYYGTPREYVERRLSEGRDVILEIEIQRALKIKAQYPDALLLFVMPPSMEELRRRLVGRGTEAEGIENYEYIVVNDDLDACVRQTHEIITAAHNTPQRNKEFIENIRTELEGEK